MLLNQEHALGQIYSKIAENLNISETMANKAIQSYNAVGKWLGDCEPSLDVRISPQGSFYLGTVIKPLSDTDEYDIDLVCLLKNGQALGLEEIKNIPGNRLKENLLYRKMLQQEGKRCWTLQYDEFHMDILPCVPRNITFQEPRYTDIKLTHKEEDNLYVPKFSNPYSYQTWFEQRMISTLNEARIEYAAKNNIQIDKVPTNRLKTPLQQAIQLLKRHRDKMFEHKDDAPISIIITTLSALAYGNESNVYSALKGILSKMAANIQNRDGQYWVPNPVMPDENFADKWNEEPCKAKDFYSWLKQAQVDIIDNPLSATGLDEVSGHIQSALGGEMTKRALSEIAEENRILRENGGLFIQGLATGITRVASKETTKIRSHTFFGK